MNERLHPQLIEVATQVGHFIEYWGFKEIHGRIWALLYLAGEPVDANFLIRNLKVSKALVSMSLKELQDFNVIILTEKHGPTQTYTFNPNIVGVITDVLLSREAKLLVQLKSSIELVLRLSDDRLGGISRKRIQSLAKMVKSADLMLRAMTSLRSINFRTMAKLFK